MRWQSMTSLRKITESSANNQTHTRNDFRLHHLEFFFWRWTLLTLCCANEICFFRFVCIHTEKATYSLIDGKRQQEMTFSGYTYSYAEPTQQQQPRQCVNATIEAKQNSICVRVRARLNRLINEPSLFSLSLIRFQLIQMSFNTIYETTPKQKNFKLNSRKNNIKNSREIAAVQWHALAITFDGELIFPLQMRNTMAPQSMLEPHTFKKTLDCPADRLILFIYLFCSAWEMKIDFFFRCSSAFSILQR